MWAMNVGKAAKAEAPLLPSGVNMVQGSKCKAKRLAEWDNPVELPTTGRSPSMKQLKGEVWRDGDS